LVWPCWRAFRAGRASSPNRRPAITRHALKIGGLSLAYEAEAGRIPIKDVATGEPLGHLFYVAYRAPAAPGKVRPITFIWNGGPGAASASLNFEGFGPKRIEGAGLVDNVDTWLTDSDLVFMDAMGVGFSRAVSPRPRRSLHQHRRRHRRHHRIHPRLAAAPWPGGPRR
jgi:carboxypeptidase C (cathepsin A)